ncbi:dual specificity protein phosphatase 22 isoform 4-T4 [Dugong dugon]
MGNGMNKILPGLYIGNFKDARDAEQLSKNKVTHILSVHDSARPMLEDKTFQRKHQVYPRVPAERGGLSCALPGRRLQECDPGHGIHHDHHRLWLGRRPAHCARRQVLCQPQPGFPEAAPGVRGARSSPVSAVAEGGIWREPFAGCRRSQNHSGDSWSSEIFGLPQKSVMYLKLLKYWKATVFRPMLPKRT